MQRGFGALGGGAGRSATLGDRRWLHQHRDVDGVPHLERAKNGGRTRHVGDRLVVLGLQNQLGHQDPDETGQPFHPRTNRGMQLLESDQHIHTTDGRPLHGGVGIQTIAHDRRRDVGGRRGFTLVGGHPLHETEHRVRQNAVLQRQLRLHTSMLPVSRPRHTKNVAKWLTCTHIEMRAE